jgi:hypothetical protein
MEGSMTKTFAFAALSLGVAVGLLGVKPSLPLQVSIAASSQHIDVLAIERSASTSMPSFDDTYQRHLGVLDVLKAP